MAKSVRVTNLKSNERKEFLIEWPVKSLEIFARQIAFCLSNMTGHVFDFSDFSKYKASINNLYLYKVMAMQDIKIELEDVADEPCFIKIEVYKNSPALYRLMHDIPYQIGDVVLLDVACDITDKKELQKSINNFLDTTYVALVGGFLNLNKTGKQLCSITVVPKHYTKVN